MIPPFEPFLEGLEHILRRHGRAPHFDRPSIGAALREASRLSDGHAEHEPAALFYTCSRRSRAFGGVGELCIPIVVRGQARAVGFELEANDVELAVLRARVLLGPFVFEELRGWFAARMRPLTRHPWPTKHPVR